MKFEGGLFEALDRGPSSTVLWRASQSLRIISCRIKEDRLGALDKGILWRVGDNENGPKDDNVGPPIDSHVIIPVIPREKQK